MKPNEPFCRFEGSDREPCRDVAAEVVGVTTLSAKDNYDLLKPASQAAAG